MVSVLTHKVLKILERDCKVALMRSRGSCCMDVL